MKPVIQSIGGGAFAPVAAAVFYFYVRGQYWCPSFVGLLVGHGVYSSPESERPVFLDVVPGMTVVVRYDHMTGENAGNLMSVIQAPNGNRLGAMLDALESDWAAAILGDMAKIRHYEHGFTMNCRVVYAAAP